MLARLKLFWKPLAVIGLAALLAWSSYHGYVSYLRARIMARAHPALTSTGLPAASEECAVYSVAVGYLFVPSVQPSTSLVLIEKDKGMYLVGKFEENARPGELALADETWEDFTAQWQDPDPQASMPDCLAMEHPYLLVEAGEMIDLNIDLHRSGLDYTPFLQFSWIGTNPAGDEAIVHLAVTYLTYTRPASVFSFGQYLLLRKEAGQWKVIQEQDTYIT